MSSNPFFEAAQSLPPPNPDDENRAGAYQSTQIPADKFATAKRNGAVLGLPATAAMTDPDLERRAQTRRTLDALRTAPPATRNFVAGPNGPMAQDDVENLSAAETAFRYFGEIGLRGTASGHYAINKFIYGLGQAAFEIPQFLTRPLVNAEILPANPFDGPVNLMRSGVQAMDTLEQTYGVSAGNYHGVVDRGVASALTSLHNNLLMLPASAELNTAGTLLSQGSRLLGSEAQSLAPYAAAQAQNRALMQATRPTVMGTALPNTRSLLPIGAQSFGQSYADARSKNLSLAASLSYASQQAGVEMVTEALPLGEYLSQARADSSLLKSFGKALLEENVGEQVATAWQDLNEWLYLNPERTFQDYLNERPNAALETAIATTFATAVMSGSSHLAMHASRKQEAAIADYHAQVLERIGKLTAASKLLERDPKSVEEILNHVVAEGGKVDTIYIDGQTLAQSGLAQQLAEASPTAREQIDQAVATGDSVAIPVAEYITQVSTTPLGDQLLDHVRTHPDGMSRAEAKTYAEEAAKTAEQETEKALEKAKVGAEFRKSQDAVRQRVLKELSGLGRFNQTTNNLYATLIAARSAARAVQLGITPEQFFEKQLLKTTSEGMTTGEKYNAPSNASKVVDNQGNPLTVYHGTKSAAGITTFDMSKAADGAHFFTPNQAHAETFGKTSAYRLDIQNPMEITQDDLEKAWDAEHPDGEQDDRNLLPRDFVAAFVEKAKAAGHDGLIIRGMADRDITSDMYLPFTPEQIKPADGYNQSVSTRLPTAKKAPENPLQNMLVIGLEAAKMDAEAFAANMQVVRAYPNMVRLRREETPEQLAERFIEHTVSNLLWLHDQVPADIRARSKLWYDGARAIVDRWQAKYPNLTDSQIAAVLAVLSPQKDWFMNVSLGERVIDILANQRNFRWDDQMAGYVDNILKSEQEAQRKKAEEEGVALEEFAPTKYYEAVARIQGKTLQEVFDSGDDRDVAVWVRVYDQAYNTRNYRIVSPEGDFQDWVRNKPTDKQMKAGEEGSLGKIAWGSFGEISKAVSVIRNGSISNISRRLGGQHKVRNFYNNIFNPTSEHGDVTIDTHAVAAALLQPLAGGSNEVKHNFGSGGVSNSSVYGAKGTYGIYAEAYRRAAAARGILPREMQSITWEAVRGLFQAEHKKRLAAPVRKIWNDYRQKRIDLNEARRRTVELAGSIVAPDWHGRPDTAGVGQSWASSYSHELVAAQLPNGNSGADGGRAGGDAGRDSAAGGSENAYRQGGLNGNDTGSPGSDQATAAVVRVPGGVRGSVELLDAAAGSQPNAGPLAGLPATVTVGGNPVTFGPMAAARAAAIAYCASAGIVYRPPNHYVKVDSARGRRIAAAYDAMQHDPYDPLVRASYEALAAETVAQYEAMLKTGIVIEFNPPGIDPYGNPRNAVLDIVNNNHLYIFSTDDGYGTTGITEKDLAENPMLAMSTHMMGGRPARINDLFRAVHDYFGHAKEGIGFRAEGEENAWQQHMAMYSAKARPAATVELRGQNSWLNFGPHAEFNKTANGADTKYAEQKIGLLPDWVVSEAWAGNGALPPQIEIDGVMRATRDHQGYPLAPPMDFYQAGNNQLLTGVAGVRAFWEYYKDGPLDDQGRPVSFYRGTRRYPTGALKTLGRETLSFSQDPGVANIYANQQSFMATGYGPGSGVMRYYINTQKILDLRGNGETTSLWGFIDALGNWNLGKQRGDKGEAGYLQIAYAVMSLDDVRHSFSVDWSTSDYDTFTELADAFIEACEEEDYDLAETLLSEVDVDVYALLDAEFGTLAATAGYDSVYHDDPLTDDAVNLYTGNKDSLEYDENYDGRSTATLRPLSPDMVKSVLNVGTYSRTTDPLYQSNTPPGRSADHIFYSALLRATENAKIMKGDANQWMGTLRNMPGVKPDEIKWLGLEEWLKEQKGIITRTQVADFIRANQVVFEESTSLREDFVPTPTPFADAEEEKQATDLIAAELANGYNTKNLDFGPLTKYVVGDVNYYLTDVRSKNVKEGFDPAKGTVIWRTEDGALEWVGHQNTRRSAEGVIGEKTRLKGSRVAQFMYVRIDGQGTNYREGVLRFPVNSTPGREMTAEEQQMHANRDSETLWRFASREAFDKFLPMVRITANIAAGDESKHVRVYPDSLTVAVFDASPVKAQIASTLLAMHARTTVAVSPESLVDMSGVFTGGHFENNVLTHMRWEDRPLADGSTALYLMEVQSDWHQQGRQHGYRSKEPAGNRDTGLPRGYHVYDIHELGRQDVRSQFEVNHGPADGWDENVRKRAAEATVVRLQQIVDMNGARRFGVRREEPAAGNGWANFGRLMETEEEARRMAWTFYDGRRRDVPNAPFENTWHELAFKRMLHLAVSENYESLVWPGDAQHVSDVEGWGPILEKKNDQGTQYVTPGGDNYSAIINRYLQDLPRFANKYIAKWGGKVERTYLDNSAKDGHYARLTADRVKEVRVRVNDAYDGVKYTVYGLDENEVEVASFEYDSLKELIGSLGPSVGTDVADLIDQGMLAEDDDEAPLLLPKTPPDGRAVFRIKITPEMRESVLAGQALFQPQEQQPTPPRGEFIPSQNIINLLQNADLSTFLHESAHYFFENDIALVFELMQKPNLTEGERSLLNDVSTLLRWNGIQGELPEQLNTWNSMSFEERRVAHERTAESFEHYLFEGKAPSMELQPVFQRFRSFLLRVYRALQDFLSRNPEAGKLNDEVRAVFDRMLATEDQIALAQRARSMGALFNSAEEAGMSPDEWQAYQAMQFDANDEAVQELQARGLRDLTWLSNLKARTVKEISRAAAEKRKAVRAEVEAQVLQERVYAAQRWLRTGEFTMPGGAKIQATEGHKLSTDLVAAMYPAQALVPVNWRKLGTGKYGMLAKGGLAPDLVAQ
ncbi:hypothetical protein UFOVP821_44, partial [uncultured Caudovirales phage]